MLRFQAKMKNMGDLMTLGRDGPSNWGPSRDLPRIHSNQGQDERRKQKKTKNTQNTIKRRSPVRANLKCLKDWQT